MKDFFSDEVVPGLYKRNIGEPIQWKYEFSPNRIELYRIHNQGEKLVATDIDGEEYPIEDPGFYDRRRRSVSEETIDSFDLIHVNDKNYEELKEDLLKTQKRTSKLLKMMENNKDNLSARNDEYIDYVRNKEHSNSVSEH